MSGARASKPSPWPPWPRNWNGGPAKPNGPPAFSLELQLETRPEGNLRSWRGRAHRSNAAISTVVDEVSVALAQGKALPTLGPFCVRLTRLSPDRPLDVGNLWSALKSVEDAVAHLLDCNDGSPAWGACVAQEKRKGPLAVRIEVWGGEAAP